MSTIKAVKLQQNENFALKNLNNASARLIEVLDAQLTEYRRYADELLDDGRKTDAELEAIRSTIDVQAQARGLSFTSSAEALDLLVLALRHAEERIAEYERASDLGRPLAKPASDDLQGYYQRQAAGLQNIARPKP